MKYMYNSMNKRIVVERKIDRLMNRYFVSICAGTLLLIWGIVTTLSVWQTNAVVRPTIEKMVEHQKEVSRLDSQFDYSFVDGIDNK